MITNEPPSALPVAATGRTRFRGVDGQQSGKAGDALLGAGQLGELSRPTHCRFRAPSPCRHAPPRPAQHRAPEAPLRRMPPRPQERRGHSGQQRGGGPCDPNNCETVQVQVLMRDTATRQAVADPRR
ncbi:hypothetical protein GCM10011374_40850 [Kocuria dechangensis]|uniref:Uncharacterized protein n=1 Tax=Kocuria dechangensis TaxID=1176249 RepID=A0A917H9H3_9MICC|nr:hypothetical protein GCM10011374_40850 [Kocuria dechangensis]